MGMFLVSLRILYHPAVPTVLLYFFIFRSLPLRDDVIYILRIPFLCSTSRVPPLNLSRYSPRPGVEETRLRFFLYSKHLEVLAGTGFAGRTNLHSRACEQFLVPELRRAQRDPSRETALPRRLEEQ